MVIQSTDQIVCLRAVARVCYLLIQQDLHHLNGRVGHRGAGAEDAGHAGLVEEVVVLGRNDTTGSDHDVLASKFLQFFDELRY